MPYPFCNPSDDGEPLLGGVGREVGAEALRFFTEAKNICIAK